MRHDYDMDFNTTMTRIAQFQRRSAEILSQIAEKTFSSETLDTLPTPLGIVIETHIATGRDFVDEWLGFEDMAIFQSDESGENEEEDDSEEDGGVLELKEREIAWRREVKGGKKLTRPIELAVLAMKEIGEELERCKVFFEKRVSR